MGESDHVPLPAKRREQLSVDLLLDVLTTCGSSPVRATDLSGYSAEFQANSAKLTDLRRHLPVSEEV